MFVPLPERHEPSAHTVHAPAPKLLYEPTAHATPTLVNVIAVTDDDALTVPVHTPLVVRHGFGERETTAVPDGTPAPVTTIPTEREPAETLATESVMFATVPVAMADAKPAAANAPAGLLPEHAEANRLKAAPYLPAGQGIGETEPTGQYEPRGHAAVHALVSKPVVEPYVP